MALGVRHIVKSAIDPHSRPPAQVPSGETPRRGRGWAKPRWPPRFRSCQIVTVNARPLSAIPCHREGW